MSLFRSRTECCRLFCKTTGLVTSVPKACLLVAVGPVLAAMMRISPEFPVSSTVSSTLEHTVETVNALHLLGTADPEPNFS